MNYHDMEQQKIREDDILVLSDECDAIEQVITFFPKTQFTRVF